MTTTSDKEYAATKRLKQGVAKLAAPFDEVAHWIASTWQVTVLNVIYYRRKSFCHPGLVVILEHEGDLMKFYRGAHFDVKKQRAIRERFSEVIGREGVRKYDVGDLVVAFSAFAPVARQEMDSQIPEEELQALKRRIGNPDIWGIDRCFGRVTFFFHTDAQAKRCESEGKKAVYAKMYFNLLKPHDEFGYLEEKRFTVSFDSKQNFDQNYRSNWFSYYR